MKTTKVQKKKMFRITNFGRDRDLMYEGTPYFIPHMKSITVEEDIAKVFVKYPQIDSKKIPVSSKSKKNKEK